MAAGKHMAQRMALVEHAFATAITNNRRRKFFSKLTHFVGCRDSAPSHKNDWTFRPGQKRGRLRYGTLIERRIRVGSERGRDLDVRLGSEHIGRKLNSRRPHATRANLLECPRDEARRIL